jgi:hypothetical protein
MYHHNGRYLCIVISPSSVLFIRVTTHAMHSTDFDLFIKTKANCTKNRLEKGVCSNPSQGISARRTCELAVNGFRSLFAPVTVFRFSPSTDEGRSFCRKASGFGFGWSCCMHDEIGTTRCEVHEVSFMCKDNFRVEPRKLGAT